MIVQVDLSNIEQMYSEVKEYICDADFASIDTEFSGIGNERKLWDR
jgi:hypothetical protein